MQPDSPYQLIEALGSSRVGSVWAAIDTEGRSLTVVVLDASIATDQQWRDAFMAAANALMRSPAEEARPLYADFSASTPWVVFAGDRAQGESGAERIFLTLGVDYQPVPPDMHDAPAPLPGTPGNQQPRPQPQAQPQPQPHGATPAPAPADNETTQPIGQLEISFTAPVNPWATGPQPAASPPAPPHPPSGPAPPLPPYGSPQSVSAPPQPISASPYSAAPYSAAPYSVSGIPQSPAVEAMPSVGPPRFDGPPPYDPSYPPLTRTVPPGSRRRRTGLLIGAVVVVLAASGAVIAWRNLSGTTEAAPTSSAAPPAVPSAAPLRPGLEPPRPGDWPAAWPKFGAGSPVQTLSLNGVGFKVTVPSTWDCVSAGSAEGSARYNCGATLANNVEVGGELIVRDCPKPCDEKQRVGMRRAEEAWGLQWRSGGEYAALAETLKLNGERRYGLALVGYWRSAPGGTVDRQVVLRMAAPVEWVDEVRRVANAVRDAAVF